MPARGTTRWTMALLAAAVAAHGACSRAPNANPQAGALYADLWMETSAEYYALCVETYQAAGRQLEPRLREHRPTADARPLAVVLDLDETVIDNTGYQALLYRRRERFAESSWTEWVRAQAESGPARCVPGACEFLAEMEKRGVAAVFVSNRGETTRPYTARTLERLGIPTAGLDDPVRKRLWLATRTQSKEERRRAVAEAFQILAYFGDNLADFAGEFEASAAGDFQ